VSRCHNFRNNTYYLQVLSAKFCPSTTLSKQSI